MWLLAPIALFCVLIFVHEFGHFLAARAVGVKAPTFSIGFGPEIFAFEWKGTRWRIGLIPFGGFVSVKGFSDDGTEESSDPDSYQTKPVTHRALILFSGVAMNILFAIGLYAGLYAVSGKHDLGNKVGAVVESSVPEFAASLRGLHPGDRIISVGSETVHSWEEIFLVVNIAPSGPIVFATEGGAELTVDLPADPRLRVSIFDGVFPSVDAVIGSVLEHSPAEAAGITPGDRIVAWNGSEIHDWGDLIRSVRASGGQTATVLLAREDGVVEASVDLTGLGNGTIDDDEVVIGVLPAAPVSAKVSVGNATMLAFKQVSNIATASAVALVRVGKGEMSPRAMGGPIMVGRAAAEAASMGWYSWLQLMALMSVGLAVFNILPIPMLDGGHLFFLGVEVLRGRKMTRAEQHAANHIGTGTVLLIVLCVVAFDIAAIFGL